MCAGRVPLLTRAEIGINDHCIKDRFLVATDVVCAPVVSKYHGSLLSQKFLCVSSQLQLCTPLVCVNGF